SRWQRERSRQRNRANASSLHLELAVDLDRLATRQVDLPDCRTGVTAVIRAEQFKEEIRGAVDDRRHIGKVGRAIDHAEQPDDAPDVIKVANLLFHSRQDRQGRDARDQFAFFDSHIGAELACLAALHVRMVRTMAGYEYDVADAHAATAVRTWECARRGKRKSHRLQFFFNGAHVITPVVRLESPTRYSALPWSAPVRRGGWQHFYQICNS